uniref:Uncharacterized protein n=1 Tax=Panagrolaimus sp. ES5 TaxID=591445 RepID=A0AC34FPK5_9BILA
MRILFLSFVLAYYVLGQDINGAQQAPPAGGQPQQQQQQQPGGNINHLIDRPECTADIQKYCKKQIEMTKKEDLSDMTVLECLQDAGFSDTETLTPGCEQAVWEVKVALTADDRFHNALTQFCADEIAKHPHAAGCAKETQKGHALSLLGQDTNGAQQAPPAGGQHQQQQQQQQQQPGGNINHLIDRPECTADIQKYCKKQIEMTKKEDLSDMTVLECLQDAGFSDTETLTPGCEQAVWEVKVALTADDRFHNALTQFCADEIAKHPHAAGCAKETQKGHALSCMMDYLLQLPKTGKCFQFLSRVQSIAFTDFRLVGTFIEKCGEAVAKLNCQSLTRNSAHKGAKVAHSQGATLECLIEKMVNVPKDKEDIVKAISNECRHEVMRIAELQSDDFHLDRPLYFACKAE